MIETCINILEDLIKSSTTMTTNEIMALSEVIARLKGELK